MSKLILIDALHITTGGGKVLLDYLCNRMIARGIDFVLLKDDRCGKLSCEDGIPKVVVLSASISARKAFYKRHKYDYTSVFCFGNIPAPIKMPCLVHTYFHNVNILAIPTSFGGKKKLKTRLKRFYIGCLAKNTDTWIVQTQNTENLVRKYLPCKGKEVMQYPFYDLPEDMVGKVRNVSHGKDYVLIGGYTWNRGHEELLEAWKKLHELGFNRRLHLTVKYAPYEQKIESAISRGVNIVNHGRIAVEDVFRLYAECKAIIYPSHGESFGLGLVEAISCGCDVIGADLPYTYCVCNPSATFKAGDADSIVKAVLRYEKGFCVKSRKTIDNKIDELIYLLCK